MLDERTLEEYLSKAGTARIAVVGDLFLDKYLDLDASLTERSIETGKDAWQVVGVRCYPGAGGTVLNNLHALGAGRLHAVSVIGDDGEGYELLRALRERNVDVSGVIGRRDRMTPTYTKPMLWEGSPRQAEELNRLDIKNRMPASAEIERLVIEQLESLVPRVDAVIIADQVVEPDHGVITAGVRDHLAKMAMRFPRCRFLADSRARIGLFRNCLTKPNRSELLAATDGPERDGSATDSATCEEVDRRAKGLHERTGQTVFVTLDRQGIVCVDGDSCHRVSAFPVSGPVDVVGAGDATTAGIVLALCAGACPVDAALVGCLVASITIQQIGVTGTATQEQVLARFSQYASMRP